MGTLDLRAPRGEAAFERWARRHLAEDVDLCKLDAESSESAASGARKPKAGDRRRSSRNGARRRSR